MGNNQLSSSALVLRQSILVFLVFFIVFGISSSLIYDGVIEYLFSFNDDLAEESKWVVVWTIPAFMVRGVNQATKVFLENMEKKKYLQYCYMALVLIFGPVSFFFVKILECGLRSFGFVLLGYEICNLLISIFFLQEYWNNEAFSFSGSSICKDFGFFFQNFFLKFLDILMWNGVLIIEYTLIAEMNSITEIITFTLFLSLSLITTNMGKNFSIGVKGAMEQSIESEAPEEVVENMEIFKRIFLGIGCLYATLIFFSLSFSEKHDFFGSNGTDVREYMESVKFIMIVKAFVSVNMGFHYDIANVVNMEIKAILAYSLPYYLSVFGSYLVCVYMEWGVMGLMAFNAVFYLCGFFVMDGFLDDELYLNKVKDRRLEKLIEGKI